MFTGIIQQKVVIKSIKEGNFTVGGYKWDTLQIGQSIAHDWACMTVDEIHSPSSYSFFAMEESFNKTIFWQKKVWDTFNIELAVTSSQKMDGHFVTWHIDCLASVTKKRLADDGSLNLYISFPAEFDTLVVPKWSIAINWVSLTVVDVWDWSCSVWLIPLTQEVTWLWNLEIWDKVNVEFDLLAKYITKYGRKE